MTVLGFLLMVCFVPGVTGMAIPSGWILLSVTIPWILREDALNLNLFFCYAIFSLLWALNFDQAIWDLWKLAILCLGYTLGMVRDPRGLWLGSAYGLTVSTVLAVFQTFGFMPVYSQGLGTPAGLFINQDIFSEICAIVSVALISERMYWPLLGVLPGLALGGGRAALVGFVVATGTMLWRYSRVGVVALALAAGGVSVTVRGTYLSTERWNIWLNTIDGLTVFGRGAGSFLTTYPVFASRGDVMYSRPEDAHNDYLQLAYQYGIGTALLIPAIFVGIFNPVALCALVIAFFSFPMAYPAEGFLASVALGSAWAHRSLVWGMWRRCRSYLHLRYSTWRYGSGNARSEPISLEPTYPRSAWVHGNADADIKGNG